MRNIRIKNECGRLTIKKWKNLHVILGFFDITKMRTSKEIIYQVSGIVILLAAIAYLFIPAVAPWIMAAGVIFFTIITAMTPYPGKSIRGKRLFSFRVLACVLMAVATYFMFRQRNEWFLIMLVAAVFLLYSAFVLPRELEKEKRKI